MPEKDPWFLDERAFAFVSLMLTKRNDVAVRRYLGRDLAIRLLIEIMQGGKPSLRYVGAQLVPYLDLPNTSDADDRVMAQLGRDPFESALPLCAFIVGVRKPEGFYRWIVEPTVHDGKATLQPVTEAKWHELDESGADRLVAQASAFYDAMSEEKRLKSQQEGLEATHKGA